MVAFVRQYSLLFESVILPRQPQEDVLGTERIQKQQGYCQMKLINGQSKSRDSMPKDMTAEPSVIGLMDYWIFGLW